jgi:hypothetical protein
MRSRPAKFAILDTSVYIDNFRTGRFAFRLLKAPYVIRCSADPSLNSELRIQNFSLLACSGAICYRRAAGIRIYKNGGAA